MASFRRLGTPVVHAHTLHVLPGALPLIAQNPLLPSRTAERALVLAESQDVVCVPTHPDPEFVALLARLELGPDPSRIVVPGGAPTAPLQERLVRDAAALRRVAELLPDSGDAWLSPLMASSIDAALAPALATPRRAVRVLGGSPELIARVNRKHVVRAVAISLGVPVAPGCVVELAPDADGQCRDLGPLETAVRQVAMRTGRAIVRGDVGAGGSSVFTASADLIPPELAAFAAGGTERILLVEEYLDIVTSPNIQVFIDPADGSATCVGVSDQLLSPGLGHRGNLYPSRAATAREMVAGALTLAGWLAREGYTGFMGFDFVEYRDARGKLQWVLAELNPRFNGASQPVAMLERLNRANRAAGRPPIAAFAAGVVSTPARSFSELAAQLGPALYDPVRGSGVVPFHTTGLPDGSCGLAVFGPCRDAAERQLTALMETTHH